MTVEQLPQTTDQDNPVPLGSRQVVDADTGFGTSIFSKGRLKENIAFWRDIGASKWVLSVIENGYYLPFISLPA